MQLVVGLVVAILIAAVCTRLTKRYDKRKPYLVAATVAVLALLSKEALDKVASWRSDPRTTVEFREPKPGKIEVRVRNGRSIVDTMEIEFSVLGYVRGIDNMFSGTAHSPVHKAVIGFETPYAQNTVQIHIPRLAAAADVNFDISYEPRPPNAPGVNLIGMDLYTYRYTWMHDGNVLERQRCISKRTAREVKRPPAQVMAGIVVPGSMMEWAKSLGEPRWRQFD